MTILSTSGPVVGAGRLARPANWQLAIKTAIRDPIELCERLRLPPQVAKAATSCGVEFPVFAPLSFVAKMTPGDVNDPLLRQVLPLPEEDHVLPGFRHDPVGDGGGNLQPGLIQKYGGRALLVVTGACAIHCRYCFRRHFNYEQVPHSTDAWQPALRHISSDCEIDEVLLSGGDPLTLVDAQFRQLVTSVGAIKHVRRLRIHTRLPIVIPERVTEGLITILHDTRLAVFVVVHANHPRELDESVGDCLERLIDSGIPVLNQSVLLRGVNDDAEVLEQLSRRLIDRRVIPYYLHQVDRVHGSGHFEVPVDRGRRLMAELRGRLPGYAVPRYVMDVEGEPSKRILS